MLEQAIRKHFQRWLVNPIAGYLPNYVKAAHVTLLALITGVMIVPALAYNYHLFAVLLLLVSGYLDMLDGTLARQSDSATAFGSVCDIMTDRIVEFAAIFGLWLVQPDERSLACLTMLGSILLCITSFLVVGIFTPNQSTKGFHYSAGLMERAEAFIFFILMIVFPKEFNWLAITFVTLVIVTTVIRLYEFKKYSLH